MSACKGYDLKSGTPCGRPATVTMTVGCEHEHVSTRPFCGIHQDYIGQGNMLCGDCHEIDGHSCLLYALERSHL